MKNNPLIHIAFTLLCLMFITACSSNVKEEIKRAEDLAVVAPDSAFAILEDIRKDALEDAKIKPEYDLVWAETYYVKNRSLTDSIHEIVFHIDAQPGSKQKIMHDILHALYLFDAKDVEEAFSHFEACSREMKDKINPYWQCVVEDYLGIISLNAGLYPQSKNHFYKVLRNAELIGDKKNISNAYSHISCFYHMTNELDSALL